MPRTRFDEEHDDDPPDDERDAPLAGDLDDDDEHETDTQPCPSCRRDVYDGVDQCPYCGAYIVRERSGAAGRSLLFIATAAVLIALLFWWTLR